MVLSLNKPKLDNLAGDQLPENKFYFDFMLNNPPFGVTWGGKGGYEKEARKLEKEAEKMLEELAQ